MRQLLLSPIECYQPLKKVSKLGRAKARSAVPTRSFAETHATPPPPADPALLRPPRSAMSRPATGAEASPSEPVTVNPVHGVSHLEEDIQAQPNPGASPNKESPALRFGRHC